MIQSKYELKAVVKRRFILAFWYAARLSTRVLSFENSLGKIIIKSLAFPFDVHFVDVVVVIVGVFLCLSITKMIDLDVEFEMIDALCLKELNKVANLPAQHSEN